MCEIQTLDTVHVPVPKPRRSQYCLYPEDNLRGFAFYQFTQTFSYDPEHKNEIQQLKRINYAFSVVFFHVYPVNCAPERILAYTVAED